VAKTDCGKTRFYFGTIPQRLKPGLILQDLRCGWKPHPFKAWLESVVPQPVEAARR
jgi:hypothetical protein